MPPFCEIDPYSSEIDVPSSSSNINVNEDLSDSAAGFVDGEAIEEDEGEADDGGAEEDGDGGAEEDDGDTYSTIEAELDGLFETMSPQGVAIYYALQEESSPIPKASKPFPHSAKKLPAKGGSALWLVDGEGVAPTYRIIARIAGTDDAGEDRNRTGQYLDMVGRYNDVSIILSLFERRR